MADGFLGKFHIGTYCLEANARDEVHVKELAECGIDVLFGVNSDRPLLDLLAKYGIGAVVNGVVPWWFGANGKNAGTMAAVNPIERYLSALESFADHPAIVGIDIGDEPSSADFPHYARVAELLGERLPDKLLYLNLYPSYGMLATAGEEQARRELGANSYSDYLRAYFDTLPLPYLSFDHYPYSSSIESLLSDLTVASRLCREYEKPLMLVIQVNSHVEDEFLTLDQLRLEARCALAYGARSISWACYSRGWWYNNVLDARGERTEQYAKLRTVNRELRSMAEEYEKYTHERTHRLASGESIATPLGRLEATSTVLVGEFSDSEGTPALLIAPLTTADGGENTASFLYINKGESLSFARLPALTVKTPSEKYAINSENLALMLKNEPIFIFPFKG